MRRETPFVSGEIYHIYNRGAHKQGIFSDENDYLRFQVNLHIANHSKPVVFRDVLKNKTYKELFSVFPADKSLVNVLAYCLMPNHFHLIIQQKVDGGITQFLKKSLGGYSMYFNARHNHSGTLFQGPFKSRYIDSDPYLLWIFAYVHLNPISQVEPGWEERSLIDAQRTQGFLNNYRFSSYYDFYSAHERPERAVLAYADALQHVDTRQDIEKLLASYQQGQSLHNST